MGKLSDKDLRKLLSCIRHDSTVVVPPLPGFDSGVHMMGDRYLVVSTDPCVGVPEEWFGWLLIHYAASDVALFGARPRYCTINLLGPPGTASASFLRIMNQACRAAGQLRVAIVTGHTGTYEGLSTMLGVCTAYGTVRKEKLITPAGAEIGDYILCTKKVGLEVAVNLSLTEEPRAIKLFGENWTKELAKLVPTESCVKEAFLLGRIAGVHAMHDATEGGLVAAINEVAENSKRGFRIEFDEIPIAKESEVLKKVFGLSELQLLSMSSTGTVLAAVSQEAVNDTVNALRRQGVDAHVMGVFTKDRNRILIKDGKASRFPRIADDPYQRILSKL
jgi:hydrogenase maturation factor